MGLRVYSDIQKAWGYIFSNYGTDYKLGEMESLEHGCFVLIPKTESKVVRIFDYGTSIGLILVDDKGKTTSEEIVIEVELLEDDVVDTIGEAMYDVYRNFTDVGTSDKATIHLCTIEAVRRYFEENFIPTDLSIYAHHYWLTSPLCEIAHDKLKAEKFDESIVNSMLQDIKDFIDEYGYFITLRVIEKILKWEL